MTPSGRRPRGEYAPTSSTLLILRAGPVGFLAAVALLVAAALPSHGALSRGAAGEAAVGPGVQMYTDGAQCTGNFVFTDRRGRTYVGYAAHCAGTGAADETDGCDAASHPLGTRVRFARGGSVADAGSTVARGRLVYSSWLTMQRLGTRSPAACDYNDFALVRLPRRAAARVDPSVPFWGGPTGLDRDGSASGDTVLSYGSSSVRGGTGPLSPREGRSLGTEGNGWSHVVYTATPGVPGDSGAAFLDQQGRAMGVLSTVSLAPLAGSNNVTDLRRALRFARRHSGLPGLRLLRGTEDFSGTSR